MSKIDNLRVEEEESSEAFEELAELSAELIALLQTCCGGGRRTDDPNREWMLFPQETVKRLRQLMEEWS